MGDEAKAIFDDRLSPLVGDRESSERGKAIWTVIFSSAWGEQNNRDDCAATSEYVRNTMMNQESNYRVRARERAEAIRLNSGMMGFEKLLSPSGPASPCRSPRRGGTKERSNARPLSETDQPE